MRWVLKYVRNSIIFEGKIDAKEEIIIIDSYVNKELFYILRRVDKRIIIISKNIHYY